MTKSLLFAPHTCEIAFGSIVILPGIAKLSPLTIELTNQGKALDRSCIIHKLEYLRIYFLPVERRYF